VAKVRERLAVSEQITDFTLRGTMATIGKRYRVTRSILLNSQIALEQFRC
jgi:hypothetical protein